MIFDGFYGGRSAPRWREECHSKVVLCAVSMGIEETGFFVCYYYCPSLQ
jgi:hypothetical protein